MTFPASPTVGQLEPPSPTAAQAQYIWTGTAWDRIELPQNFFGQIATMISGPWIEIGGLFVAPNASPSDGITRIPALLTHT